MVAAGWRVFQDGKTFASCVDGQRSPSDSGVATAFDDHDSLQFLRVLQNSPVEGELVAHLLLPVLGVVDDARVLDGRLCVHRERGEAGRQRRKSSLKGNFGFRTHSQNAKAL